MQPHQQRVVEESEELDAKLEKLINFINSGTFSSLDREDQSLLIAQKFYMIDYSHVLHKRIARFQ